MNIRQLEIFYEVSKTENFSKAAEKFLLPSSAVSAMIKRLEEELGINLLNRSSNKITLTSEGRKFANKLDLILPILRSSINEISGTNLTSQTIKILVRTRPKWISEMVENFLRNNTGIKFIISKDYSAKDFNNYDIIISSPLPEFSKWNNFLLSTETSCIKAHKDSPLANTELSFKDIASMSFILHPHGDISRSQYEQICAKCGVKENILIEVNDSLLLESFVKSGMGLTIGSYKSLSDKYSSDLIPLNVKDFNDYFENTFVYFKDTKENSAIKLFCDYLHKNRSIT